MVVVLVPSTRWQSKQLHSSLYTNQAPQHRVAEPDCFYKKQRTEGLLFKLLVLLSHFGKGGSFGLGNDLLTAFLARNGRNIVEGHLVVQLWAV